MRSLKAAVAVLALAMASSVAARTKPRTCDRACLDDVLSRYLDAVVNHDPAAAPLAAGYRHTENAKAVPLGKGVWTSITGFGNLRRHFIDPVTGAAGFYGTLLEGDNGMIVTVRLQTEDRLVTEAEWYIARTIDPTAPAPGPGLPHMVSVAGAEATPPPAVPLARDHRVPRRVMIAAANAYFDSLQTADESLMPAVPLWTRLENGFGTGRGPGGAQFTGPGIYAGKAPQEPTLGPIGPDGCPMICNVAARRYPMVDEEAGVVLGLVVFERPAGSAMARNLLSEWFTFDEGKITGIYAAMYFLGAFTPAPNWPPYSATFPLQPGCSAGHTPPALPPGFPQASPPPAAAK